MNRKRKNSNDVGGVVCVPKKAKVENVFELVEEGDVAKLKNTLGLHTGIDLLNDRDEHGDSYLHRFLVTWKPKNRVSLTEMVQFLVSEAPLLARVTNHGGYTALALSCMSVERLSLVKCLVQLDPGSVNIADQQGNTPLHHLISKAVRTVNIRSRYRAAEFLDLASLLLHNGADVNKCNNVGMNPLICLLLHPEASKVTIKDLLSLLTEHGATMYDAWGSHVVKYIKCSDILEFITESYPIDWKRVNQRGVTLLQEVTFLADFCGNQVMLAFLVKRGFLSSTDVRAYGSNLSGSKFKKELQFLTEHFPGYDVNAKNKNGMNLLFLYSTDASNIKELLALGADPEILNDKDESVLYVACNYWKKGAKVHWKKNLQIVKLLLQKSSDSIVMDGVVISVWRNFEASPSQSKESQGWFGILCTIFERPVFRRQPIASEIVTLFFSVIHEVIADCFGDDLSKARQVLKLLLSTNPGVVDMTQRDKSSVAPLYLRPVTFVLRNVSNCTGNIPQLVQMMLELGFSVTGEKDNELTALTAYLLLFFGYTGRFRDEDFCNNVFQYLVNQKVNLESMALLAKTPDVNFYTSECISLKNDMLLSDALYIIIQHTPLFMPETTKTLISSWWAPPLLLVTFNKGVQLPCFAYRYPPLEVYLRRADKVLARVLPILCSYGGVPHGTEMYKKLMQAMEGWLEVAVLRASETEYPAKFLCHLQNVLQVTSAPLSLTELCKYAVRRQYAEAACQPGVSLPQLLHQALPPLLRNVVIH